MSKAWFHAKRYAVAVGSAFVALVFSQLIQNHVGSFIFFFFYPAILIVAWYQGFGPAVCTLVLSDIAILYVVLPSTHPLPIESQELVRVALFTAVNVIILIFAEARRRDYERSRLIVSSMSDGLCFVDKDWKVSFVNEPAMGLLENQGEKAIGRLLWDVAPWLASGTSRELLEYALRQRQIARLEQPLSSHGRLLQVSASPSEGGLLLSWIDVTERVEREAIIRENNERQRLAIEAGHIGFWDWDIAGEQMTWSARTYEIAGLTPNPNSEAVSDIRKIIHPEDLPSVQSTLRKLMKTRDSYLLEFRIIRPDGDIRWISMRGQAIFNDDGVAIRMLGATIDVTERRKTEDDLKRGREELAELNAQLEQRVETRTRELLEAREALYQSQKLEAVGRLAGGVAHDFNNLMTGVRGIAEELREDMTPGTAAYQDIDEIVKAVERANGLTRQLLAFSRQQMAAPTLLSINSIIDDTKTLLQRMIGEHIALQTTLAPQLASVKVDRGQIEQILLNLILNARDAMPDGGQITIETANVPADAPFPPRSNETRHLPYVSLTVSDTGVGMDDEVRQHIFEPFYTTKGKEKGNGLGLATVYGIVKQNGGDISVYSAPSVGSTFKIYLPVAKDLPPESVAEAAPAPATGGHETILVVEDEPIVRRVAVRALAKHGYRILEASNGKNALDLLTGFNAPVDLLFTDVIMPGMNGQQLVEMVRALRPKIKVLYTSGFTADVIGKQGMLNPGIYFIEKTFTGDQLALKVRDVLDT